MTRWGLEALQVMWETAMELLDADNAWQPRDPEARGIMRDVAHQAKVLNDRMDSID